MRFALFPILALGLCAVLCGCTAAPPAPTPEQHLADVKNNLSRMEYDIALKNLDRLVKAAGDQPLGQQGRVLNVAVLTALAEGHKRMAEAFEEGRKQPAARLRETDFARMRMDYYGLARVHLVQALEVLVQQRGVLGEQAIPLDIPFPSFTGTEHAALGKVRSGLWVDEGSRAQAEQESIRNSLARILASLVGAGDDVHKGREIFQQGGMQVDPRVYLVEMSSNVLRAAEIFDREALDDARYRRICNEATRDTLDLLLKMLEAKPDKRLETKTKKMKAQCEKALKALGS